MGNRRKDEGGEDLQLQLVEVTRDPALDKHTLRHNNLLLVIREKLELGNPEEVMRLAAKVVH